MSETNLINLHDFQKFKEDVIARLEKTDDNFIESNQLLQDNVNSRIKLIEKSLEAISLKYNGIQSSITKNQPEIDKINGISTFQENYDQIIYNVNSKITSITNDLKSYKYKIDALSSNKLQVQDLIGEDQNCKYKSFEHFVSVLI